MYPLRDKKQIARKKNITRNLLIVVLFVVISVSGVLIWSGKFFNYVSLPVLKANNFVSDSLNNSGYIVKTKASVYRENELLKKENIDLRVSMIDYQVLKKENDDLKELMGRPPFQKSFLLANILTKPNRSLYDTIIIDVGSNMGILEGEKIFAGGNVPIGQISKVYSDSSLVMLYSNPGQKTEAMIDGSNASVELVGRGGGNFEMTIPNDLISDNGTAVVLPGSSIEVVALIKGVISKPTDPVKKVILRSPLNIQNLKWVQIKK